MSCTVVTAFYPIKSKFTKEKYFEWSSTFLRLESPIVLFTDESLVDIFRAQRGPRPIHIITMPFEELDTWKLYKDKWIQNHTIDPENSYHTPELYAIWAQKAFFVKQALELNPFKTEFFFWCDIGAFRNSMISETILNSFPTTQYFKNDKLLLQGFNTLNEREKMKKEDGIWGEALTSSWNKISLVGGLWGGSTKACLRWFELYKKTLEKYFEKGRFAGKDQAVMLSTYLEHPDIADIVECTIPDIDSWFFLEYLLSNMNAQYTLNTCYLLNRPVVSVNIMGGLGNQMFQLATAYAYAKKYNGTLQVFRNKRFDDGRPIYWNSVLNKFTPYLVDSLPNNLSVWSENGATEYSEIPALPENGMYLRGYLQSPKYFSDETTKKELKSLFEPTKESLSYVSEKFADLLANKNNVIVVHARRTDYLKNEHMILFHGPQPPTYYKNAIKNMCSGVTNPIFLLASDDPSYWSTILEEIPEFNEQNMYILNNENEINTLTLLQQFHYFIIANSTFSWWATWLSSEPRKVIAPSHWFGPTGPKNYKDIYCDDWQKM
jgi:hypothetical protein